MDKSNNEAIDKYRPRKDVLEAYRSIEHLLKEEVDPELLGTNQDKSLLNMIINNSRTLRMYIYKQSSFYDRNKKTELRKKYQEEVAILTEKVERETREKVYKEVYKDCYNDVFKNAFKSGFEVGRASVEGDDQ